MKSQPTSEELAAVRKRLHAAVLKLSKPVALQCLHDIDGIVAALARLQAQAAERDAQAQRMALAAADLDPEPLP